MKEQEIDVDFFDLVSRDIKKNETDDEYDFLRKPENLENWIETLQKIKTSAILYRKQRSEELLKEQVRCLDLKEGRRIYLNLKLEFVQWERKQAHFVMCIEQRLGEARRITKQQEIIGNI